MGTSQVEPTGQVYLLLVSTSKDVLGKCVLCYPHTSLWSPIHSLYTGGAAEAAHTGMHSHLGTHTRAHTLTHRHTYMHMGTHPPTTE